MACFHTIASGETMSEIAQSYNIDDWHTIWDNSKNVSIRKYWPLGSATTERQLPIGRTIFIPGTNRTSDSLVEKEEHRNFVVRSPLVGDLHLKIQYFKKFENYGWWPEHFNYPNGRSIAYDEYEQMGGESEKSVFSEAYNNWNDNVGIYYDHATHDYITRVLDSNTRADENIVHGTVTLTGGFSVAQGNPTESDALANGYVYIFTRIDRNADFDLSQTYHAFEDVYQPINVSASDDSHQTAAGAALDYIVIKDFFPRDQNDESLHKETFLVTSDIPLSKKTLFEGDSALIKRAHIIGSEIVDRTWMLDDQYRRPVSGSTIQDDFLSSGRSIRLVDTRIRNMIPTRIGGKRGFILTVPNAKAEAKRRADDFKEKLNYYLEWREGDVRSKKVFVWGVVKNLLSEGSIHYAGGWRPFADIDQNKMKEFEDEQEDQVKSFFLPSKHATLHLIAWFQDERFKQLIRNYSDRFDTPSLNPQNDYQDQLLEFLNEVFDCLNITDDGNEYFGRIWDDANSFYHMLLDTSGSANIHQDIKKSPESPDKLSAFRKVNGGVMKFIEKFVPILAKKIGPETLQISVLATAQIHFPETRGIVYSKWKMADGSFKFVRSEVIMPSATLDISLVKSEIKLYDIHNNAWYERVKQSGSVLGNILEMVNLYVAVTTLLENEDKEKISELAIAAIGAFADLMISFADTLEAFQKWNLVEKFKPLRFLSSTSKFIPICTIITGAVDFVLGIKGAIEEFHLGNYALAFGNAMIAASGAFGIASGFVALKGMIVTGSVGGAASGGTLLVISIICAVIGTVTKVFADTAIENWAEACFLGRSATANSETLQGLGRQIDNLMRLLCTFEVTGPLFEDRFDMSTYGSEYMMIIKPNGLITSDSVIEFTNLTIEGRRRSNLDPFEQSFSRIIAPLNQESSNPMVSWTVFNNSDNSIDRIGFRFRFRDFVDRVSGRTTLKVLNSTFQHNLPEHISEQYRALVHHQQF